MVNINDNNHVDDDHDDSNNDDNISNFGSSCDSNAFSQSAPGHLSSMFFKRNRFTSEMENIPEDGIVEKFQSNENVNKFQNNVLAYKKLSTITSDLPPRDPYIPPLYPKPEHHPVPDGGYGWLIVAAAFLCNFFIDGIANSFGPFMQPYETEFKSTKAATSLIGSLLVGFYLLSGPLAGGLLNKYDGRTVVLVGTILSVLSFFGATFCTNIIAFYVVYSVLGGLGIGLIYLPGIVLICQYFESKRALATGIAMSGSGAGTFAMPIIFNFCIGHFGWKITLYILSGLVSLCVACAFTYRPLPYQNNDIEEVLTYKASKQVEENNRPENPKKDYPHAAMLKEIKNVGKIAGEAVSEAIDIKLLKNPVIIILVISNSINMLGFYVPFVYIFQLAQERGCTATQAVLLLSILGIANTIGRVFFGYLADLNWLSPLALYNWSQTLCGALIMICPFFMNFNTLAMFSGLFGFIAAAYIGLTSIVLSDLMGVDQLAKTFGIVLIGRGIASLLGTPLAGIVYDYTKSYNICFYVAGGLLVLSSAISWLIPLFHKKDETEKNKVHPEDLADTKKVELGQEEHHGYYPYHHKKSSVSVQCKKSSVMTGFPIILNHPKYDSHIFVKKKNTVI